MKVMAIVLALLIVAACEREAPPPPPQSASEEKSSVELKVDPEEGAVEFKKEESSGDGNTE